MSKTNVEQKIEAETKITWAEAFEQGKTKSAAIRLMAAAGYTRGQISKESGLRYQHVRNVLITPVKKA